MKEYLLIFLKGFGMGVANVIPGLSGGTLAFITRIYERMIHSIRSFDLKAWKFFFTGQIKEFITYTDFFFLITFLTGLCISFISLAKIFDYLFANYSVYVWSFFFGLIFASIYFVGRTIEKWNFASVLLFIAGTAGAFSLTMMHPANESNSFFYLFLCGVAGICSMILPGLSGSFILILMGNYELILIKSINRLDLEVLAPVMLGVLLGIFGFSYLLSWIYKKFKNQIMAVLTGFILGSINILWPWKTAIYKLNELGHEVMSKSGQPVIEGYHYFIPEKLNTQVLIAIGLIIAGILFIWILEKIFEKKTKQKPVQPVDLLNLP